MRMGRDEVAGPKKRIGAQNLPDSHGEPVTTEDHDGGNT